MNNMLCKIAEGVLVEPIIDCTVYIIHCKSRCSLITENAVFRVVKREKIAREHEDISRARREALRSVSS